MMTLKINSICLVLCLCGIFFATSSCKYSTSPTLKNFKVSETSYQRIAKKILESSKPAVWDLPADQKQEDLFLNELKSSILTGLDRFAYLEKVNQFKTKYGRDISVGVLRRNGQRFLDNFETGKINVLAYPQAARTEGGVKALIAYQPLLKGGGRIVMPGFKGSDMVWHYARFFHELYHQYEHDTGQKGALADPNSEAWNLEEVRAHEFAANVLDQGTRGKYSKVVNSIASKSNSATLLGMIESITYEDMLAVDQLFAKGSQEETMNRLPQYYLDICFAWLRAKYEGDDLAKNQIIVYKSL